MPKVIISDTSCFILLSTIHQLHLLKELYGEVVTTPEVAMEYGDILPDWVILASPTNSFRQNILENDLDKGEASAIALAAEIQECTIILDDNKARKIARQLGLSVTGTLGIIIKAKLVGLIPSIKPIMSEIKSTNFFISEALLAQSIKEAEEEE